MLAPYTVIRFFHILWLLLSFGFLWTGGIGSARAEVADMDFLLPSGGGVVRDAAGRPKAWKFAEYSGIRLAAKESLTGMNDHPAKVDASVLERALKALDLVKANDRVVPLFDVAEANALAVSLSQALVKATAQEDVLLFSSARRESGMLAMPTTVVARLFMSQGQLHVIVQEARAELVAKIRSTRLMPELSFGSRAVSSAVQLKAPQGQLLRADWVAQHLAERALPAPDKAVEAPRPAAAEVPGAPRDAAYFKAQAARLEGLRQLREQSLISEDEYQQKRKAIVDAL